MNWELVISVVALLTGGGCVIWIFNAGIWKGEVSTRLNTHESKLAGLDSVVENRVGMTTGKISTSIGETVSVAVQQLRTEIDTKLTRIHERLDDDTEQKANQQTQSKVDSLIAGLQEQRKEWDILRDDVRSLLRSEATTTNEIQNFKERLTAFEAKLGISLEKTTRLESDVAHITADRRK